MISIAPRIRLDPDEFVLSFIHASGPGGQNVNKVASAVQLRWDVARSPSLPDAVRQRLVPLAGRRLTTEGVLVITARRHRTQEANRQDAVDRVVALVTEAANPPAPRFKTRVPRGEKRRRREDKGQRGETKRLRGRPTAE
jgi:ribosome-associated protein